MKKVPESTAAAWHEFRRGRFESPPRLYYRPLSVGPAVLKRRLYEVAVENIEDPTLAEPFQQRHSGFGGYDALQEGLAVLTEYLVGGLSGPRLRMLAARAWAVHALDRGPTSWKRSACWTGTMIFLAAQPIL